MEPIQITLPREIRNCPFSQYQIVEAIVGMCSHFFEKDEFLKYIDMGGRNCPLCQRKIEWYAEVPRFNELLGGEVQVNPIKLKGEHRIEHHQETASLEEGVVINLFLIEQAAEATHHPFMVWCEQKDWNTVVGLQAQMNYDPVSRDSQVEALRKESALLKKLYASFNYEECTTIQDFVNKFLGQDLNFFLYNLLLKEAFVHQIHESAQHVMGGKFIARTLNAEQIVDDAELGKKVRTVVGLVFTLSLIVGIGRKIF